MTIVIRDSNMLPIPEELVRELGLQVGSTVEVTRTANGFEVQPAPPGLRRGADGKWRTQAERIAILDRLQGQGKGLVATGCVEDFLRMRDEEAALELSED